MAEISEKGGNFLTILKAIPKEEVLRKQAAVRRIGEYITLWVCMWLRERDGVCEREKEKISS